mgnify:CR=1 FL=1
MIETREFCLISICCADLREIVLSFCCQSISISIFVGEIHVTLTLSPISAPILAYQLPIAFKFPSAENCFAYISPARLHPCALNTPLYTPSTDTHLNRFTPNMSLFPVPFPLYKSYLCATSDGIGIYPYPYILFLDPVYRCVPHSSGALVNVTTYESPAFAISSAPIYFVKCIIKCFNTIYPIDC